MILGEVGGSGIIDDPRREAADKAADMAGNRLLKTRARGLRSGLHLPKSNYKPQ